MRILDRYVARQILPVWFWCLLIFVSLSVLIDLFGHLDEIIRYQIPPGTILLYYATFAPLVVVKASPIALLVASSFITSRLTRFHEFLAMKASGTSLLRSAAPFLFVGWMTSILVFAISDRIIPQTEAIHAQLRQSSFRGEDAKDTLKHVAIIDNFNRLYHARTLDLKSQELTGLTVLEHDWHNRPTKSLHATRAIHTPHGWLLLYGTIYRLNEEGRLRGNPEPFVERLITYPVTPESFTRPESRPEIMPFGQLRLMITRLRHMGITNVRNYTVELASKISLPFMNVLMCLIGFVVSSQYQLRGHLQGLGMSLAWGFAYFVLVAIGQGVGKEGLLPVPIAVWLPHVIAASWCVHRLRHAR